MIWASMVSPLLPAQAVRQLEAMRLRDDEQEAVWRSSLKKLYLNLSLCNLRQRKSQLALSNCRRVLELDGKNVKAFFRIGQVCLVTGHHTFFPGSPSFLSTAFYQGFKDDIMLKLCVWRKESVGTRLPQT